MTAAPYRIGLMMQRVRGATAETPAAAGPHGALARKDDEPVETFFENVADAELVARQRQALLSPERRRFAAPVRGLDEVLGASIAVRVAGRKCARMGVGRTARSW